MDKRDRANIFRSRLVEAMSNSDFNRSTLALACQVDRSTIAQLLNVTQTRLPNAHLAAECAATLGVSADWLLGLTDRSETTANLLTTSFRFTDAERTPADKQIDAWHQEARGYKIRHVPATLPDILKTDAVLEFEYAAFKDKTPEQALSSIHDKTKWLDHPGSDYEICVPRDLVESLAKGEGYWRGLSKAARIEQIQFMSARCKELYPSLRLYLYDSKVVFSAPFSVFGSLLVAVYVGRYYLVFREFRQVRAMTEHFDQLVRNAEIDARSAADCIADML